MTMPSFNPNKRILIEIRQCIDPAKDYEVWDIRDKDKSRCIERNASEVDVMDILDKEQYFSFRNGQFKFSVPASLLSNQFSYLY